MLCQVRGTAKRWDEMLQQSSPIETYPQQVEKHAHPNREPSRSNLPRTLLTNYLVCLHPLTSITDTSHTI